MNIDKFSKNQGFPGQKPNLEGLKVLVAEDNQLNILIVRKILTRWNIQFSIAENGWEAVQMAKKEAFDIILMDVQMPVMDGIDASREIKIFNHDIPIVVVTSLSSEEVKDTFNQLGIDDFVFKPFNKEYLFQVLLKYALKKDKVTYYC